jgi:hypothetical protein
MEAARSPETSQQTYHRVWYKNVEGYHLNDGSFRSDSEKRK